MNNANSMSNWPNGNEFHIRGTILNRVLNITGRIFYTHNKSPKGHWSLTWVQWALLFKVRFLSKWLIRKHDCHICEISPNSKQSGYFNSGYEDAFGLLLLYSDLKKKSSKEGTPHWPIFVPPWIHLWADLAKKPKRMCRAMITLSLPSLVNIYQSVL